MRKPKETEDEWLPLPEISASDASRFWSKVQIRPDGCWVWRGALRGGYGRFRIGERVYTAHRVSYELLHGPLPAGHVLDHGEACSNRRCLRPGHLEVVSLGENTRRSNDRRYSGDKKGG